MSWTIPESIVQVSIITPLYNKEHWVRRTLDSIAVQTFTDYELLVTDDGSTDGGADIVTDYGDPRFRLIRQSNAGPGAARNRGIAEAKGRLLAFLDADDEWLPNYLEDSVRLLDNLGDGVASISSGYFEDPSGVSREPMWRARGITEGSFRLDPSTPPLAAVHRLIYMSPCSTVVRASIIQKWGGFYSRDSCQYGEDSYLWLKVLLNETVAFHLAPTVRFHREASELSNKLKRARPVEPFLLHPSEIRNVCPQHLLDLLSNILAIRAFRTTCMLGYWGRWREARSLMERFSVSGDWKLPYFLPAKICSMPLGSHLGRFWRTLNRSQRL